jgi:hypothetical protein
LKDITAEKVFSMAKVAGWTRERKPAPFPGKSPTRLCLFAMKDRDRKTFAYMGKPYPRLREQWTRFINRAFDGHTQQMTVIEYDRKGPIHYYVSADLTGVRLHKVNNSLWQHYHPEVAPGYDLRWLSWNYEVTPDSKYCIA